MLGDDVVEDASGFADEYIGENAEFDIAGVSYVQTVNDNYEGFTKEYDRRPK